MYIGKPNDPKEERVFGKKVALKDISRGILQMFTCQNSRVRN